MVSVCSRAAESVGYWICDGALFLYPTGAEDPAVAAEIVLRYCRRTRGARSSGGTSGSLRHRGGRHPGFSGSLASEELSGVDARDTRAVVGGSSTWRGDIRTVVRTSIGYLAVEVAFDIPDDKPVARDSL